MNHTAFVNNSNAQIHKRYGEVDGALSAKWKAIFNEEYTNNN